MNKVFGRETLMFVAHSLFEFAFVMGTHIDNDELSFGFENSLNFIEGLLNIMNMLKNKNTKSKIKLFCFEWKNRKASLLYRNIFVV